MPKLDPDKAQIFRIVHVDNLPWIFQHGLHCRNSPSQDPNYINIGSESLIDKRSRRQVPIAPGGTLSDYVPFYFTPRSIMLCNIHSGYAGVKKRTNDEIVILVSSIPQIEKLGLTYAFTNQHAYSIDTDFFNQRKDLKAIDWSLLQSSDFKKSDEDPGKGLRYQAEALVYNHVPLEALLGIACHSDQIRKKLESLIAQHSLNLKVKTIPSWYFR